MARPLRIELAGGLYHVTSRGDRREDIYLDDEDRRNWLAVLSQACERHNWRIYAYCQMTNHYHIVVETLEGNLSKGMRHLNGVYTQNFNRRHNRVGHVFQGRFKGILVEKETYLLELSRYVVLNPIRAGMESAIGTWPWSSYPAMVEAVQRPQWLEADWLLSQFGKKRKRAIQRYMDYVREGIGSPSIWTGLTRQIYLGSDHFADTIQHKVERGDRSLEKIPKVRRRPPAEPLDYYKKRYRNENEAMARAYLSGGYLLKEVGKYFGVHYSTVSRAVKAYEKK